MMDELKIFQKWEDMHIYLYVALRSYPKSERFTLSAETTKTSIDVGTSISRANACRDKRRWIDHADVELARLKVMVRIGMKMQFLSIKKYEILSTMLTEIGRMLGGWLKSCS